MKFYLYIFMLAACVLLSGCYTLKQGGTFIGYLGKAVPLESLLKVKTGDDAESIADAEKNRRFVERVQDIRRFAQEELGLNMTKNYTRYVQLDRSYLAAVVSASATDSFTRHEWRYPVVGVMPYKGFFNVKDARKERAKLEKKGLDVWVRGVDAFSTLGWFKDPLFSYMRDYSPDRLADLIIHESLHATVFIKGQVQFNEELAEFVGTEGARLYMAFRFGVDSAEYQAMFTGKEDHNKYVAFMQEVIAELQTLYNSDSERETILSEKERIIAAAKERFDAEYESRFDNENYRGFSAAPVNNAYLELYRLYYSEDSFFADLYERSGSDLPAFIAAAKTMPKKGSGVSKGDGRERLAIALGIVY
jgi:predicted aminopeptidase